MRTFFDIVFVVRALKEGSPFIVVFLTEFFSFVFHVFGRAMVGGKSCCCGRKVEAAVCCFDSQKLAIVGCSCQIMR